MIDTMAEWMSFPLYYTLDGQDAPPRSGAAHATIYPYGPFTAGDGRVVMLGLQNEREWKIFCDKVLCLPDLAGQPRFVDNAARTMHRAELRQLIEAEFATLTADAVIARLDTADIANAHVNTMADLWQHPQLASRQRWSQVDSPAGLIPTLLPPGSDAANPARMGRIPGLGEHTDAILAEFGFDPAQLRASGAV
jgi:itaconate CoA-transferase